MKIVTVVGARPQFIKAAVVSRIIEKTNGVSEVLVHTGQHFDNNMSDIFFTDLGIKKPDYNLHIGGGTHGQNTGRMIEALEKLLLEEKPNCVLVYGDTDSTLAGALAAVKLHIPITHVEAGLRSFNRKMPEEINRLMTDNISELLFAPTATAVSNLKNEGISENKVFHIGDVMYDATLYYLDKTKRPDHIDSDFPPFILCTIHRAENTNDLNRLKNIINSLNAIAKDHKIILPIHPRTAQVVQKNMDLSLHENITIIEPVGFLQMHWLLQNCIAVMTDSGGVQKEAFFHKKPCVTLRDETEWVELVDAGVNFLASPEDSTIELKLAQVLDQTLNFEHSFFGDGHSGEKIVDTLIQKIGK